ncbi:MAG: tRNA (N(6)-L-threonylcarbamoyladenosine(37)-C(2))-methylthiotransferase MtaB [Erysipelotrichaceae bacterium]|nr:tRNA (N(6)-L-threonylcarbamoyladenosine(37)-C(2))-methylthiotransferase MtaB [Erysipelotrichaceae bacterium]
MPTYAICTLGCKVNTFEAQAVSSALKSKGLVEVDFKEKADVYCIFTCAVTNTAESKSRKMISQALRRNPDALMCVVGCLVQIHPEDMKDADRIDLLVGSSGKELIADRVMDLLEDRRQIHEIKDVRKEAEFEGLFTDQFEHQTRAYLKVQDGCNQFCSYCVIPYARGKERSLKPSEAILQAKALSEHHREIVLAGIHTGRYGREYDKPLHDLMKEMLEACPKLERLRISSIEISEITDEFLDLMASNPRVAHHLHIPVQSGCDTVLKRMNRPYTTEEFLKRVAEIRQRIPGISISTDLIVGFQSETDEEFDETMDLLKKANFSFVHCFPFSMKNGTAAQHIGKTVNEQIKKQRAQKVAAWSDLSKKSYELSFIGKEVDVLIEKTTELEGFGHSSEYVPVRVLGNVEKNTVVRVVCTHYEQGMLSGKRV